MKKNEAALLVWPLLVDAARHKKTITYAGLSNAIGTHWRAMRHPLSVIQDYCIQHNLPPLTALVVLQQQGIPGRGFIAPRGTQEETLQSVWDHPWPGNVSFESSTPRYWVLLCNPKLWPIDQFIERGIRKGSWGIRKADKNRFAAGHLALVRVGVDRRNKTERKGRPKLQPGVHAICQIDSRWYPGTGKSDGFGAVHPKGWPTVRITYLHTFLTPLTIEMLRNAKPPVARRLIDGLQASSFPIEEQDFRTAVELLGLDFDDLGTEFSKINSDDLSSIEDRYANAAPSVTERISRYIERGPIGSEVKKATNYKCQICQSLGMPAKGFRKRSGVYYVEAHHVVPIAGLVSGSLSARNVITVCANHHRQLHYGNVSVQDCCDTFEFEIDERRISVPKNQVKPS